MIIIKIISVILLIIAIASAGIAGVSFLKVMVYVQSAPQEASLSAMTLVIIILPYCVARGFDEIFKKDKF